MHSITRGLICLIPVLVLAGCETTNSIPYKASTTNVLTVQQKLQTQNRKVQLGTVAMAPGVEEHLLCRLSGEVKVAPGKTLPQYIKEAFQEELFMAQAYATDAPAIITGTVDKIGFSSVAPAFWEISMSVKSNFSPGYQVSTKYVFNTSWTAYSACKNVADAFAPAVQDLLKEVVNHPGFANLAEH